MKRLRTPELFALTTLSAFSHFWRLFTPNAVVFDEKYYKEFAGHYLVGTFYTDVHPPLVNLLYAAVARLSGVSAVALLGPEPVPVLRVLPALCGTLIVPLGYVILRELDASSRVATLGALALLCENALLVDTRFTFIEPILICAGLGAVAAYLAARARTGLARASLLALSGLLAGVALSAKWTGASALGIVLVAWAFDEWRRTPRSLSRAAAEGVLLVALPAAVYVSVFAVHFALMTHYGVGQAGMSTAFRRTLIGGPQYDPTARISLYAELRDVHHEMTQGNRSLVGATHPGSSPWYTWPIMKHPIGLWENTNASAGTKQIIILLGNPVIWWGGLAGAVLALVLVARGRLSPDERFGIGLLGGAYLLNVVPFAAITRLMYIYHYLFAVAWLALLAAFAVGVAAGWNDDDALLHFASSRSRAAYAALVALIVVAFLYFLPFSYGWAISQQGFDNRFWVLHPGG